MECVQKKGATFLALSSHFTLDCSVAVRCRGGGGLTTRFLLWRAGGEQGEESSYPLWYVT